MSSWLNSSALSGLKIETGALSTIVGVLAAILAAITVSLVSTISTLKGRALLKKTGEADIDYFRWDSNLAQLGRNLLKARTGVRLRIVLSLFCVSIFMIILQSFMLYGIAADDCRIPNWSQKTTGDAICNGEFMQIIDIGIADAVNRIGRVRSLHDLDGIPEAISIDPEQDLHGQAGPRDYAITDITSISIAGTGLSVLIVPGTLLLAAGASNGPANVPEDLVYYDTNKWINGTHVSFENVAASGNGLIVNGLAVSAVHSTTENLIEVAVYDLTSDESFQIEIGRSVFKRIEPQITVALRYSRTAKFFANPLSLGLALLRISGSRVGRSNTISHDTIARAFYAAVISATLTGGSSCRSEIVIFKRCTTVNNSTVLLWIVMGSSLGLLLVLWCYWKWQAKGAIDFNSSEAKLIGLLDKVDGMRPLSTGFDCANIDVGGGEYVIRIVESNEPIVTPTGQKIDKHLVVTTRADPRGAVPYVNAYEVGRWKRKIRPTGTCSAGDKRKGKNVPSSGFIAAKLNEQIPTESKECAEMGPVLQYIKAPIRMRF